MILTRNTASTTIAPSTSSIRAAYQPTEYRCDAISLALRIATARVSSTTDSQTCVTVSNRPATMRIPTTHQRQSSGATTWYHSGWYCVPSVSAGNVACPAVPARTKTSSTNAAVATQTRIRVRETCHFARHATACTISSVAKPACEMT